MDAFENAPIGVGILGAGRPNIATSHHIPACLRSAKVRIVALCDRLEGVRKYAADVGAIAYTDYDAMLADPRVRMVQVATPDWLHAEHALRALAAGKHVLLQKPPCLSPDELMRLRRAAESPGPRLKIALNNRWTRNARTLRNLVVRGAIGALKHIRISYRGHRFPISDTHSLYLCKESGGVWLHNGLHWLDEACFYADRLPTRLQVFATRNPHGPPELLGEGPNYWSAVFELGADITFRFEYNTMLMKDGLPGGMQRVLIGTEGELRQVYGSPDITLFTPGGKPRTYPLLDSERTPADDVIHSFRSLIEAFADELIDGRPRPPLIRDSLALTEALLVGLEIADAGARRSLSEEGSA